MPSQEQSQTPEEYLRSGIISIVAASLTDDCTICTEAYTAPAVLACGHIFCRECLKGHLGHGGSTCPICRAVLFCPPPAYAGALVRVRPVEEVFVNRRVVARGDMLTRHGAALMLRDLWCYTAVSLHQHSVFGGYAIGPEEAGDMDVEMLRSTIQRVVPRDVRLGQGSWAVLYDVARLMLRWCCMVRTGEASWRMKGGEGWPPGEVFEDMVEELLAASREDGGR